MKNGYSLFEILVALGLLAAVIFVAGQVFFSTLKSGSKSEVTSRVKQNANFALATLERSLLSSRVVTSACTGQATQAISYLNADGKATTFSCANSALTLGGENLMPSDTKVISCSIVCTKDQTSTVVIVSLSASEQSSAALRVEEKSQISVSARMLLRNKF